MTDPVVLRNLDQADNLIRSRTAFRSAIRKTPYGTFTSMSGKLASDGYLGSGQLPAAYLDLLYLGDFAVYSYETPIAWHLPMPATMADRTIVELWLADGEIDGTWVMPDVKYSRTTTSHQSQVRCALGGWSWRNPNPAIPYTEISLDGAPVRVDSGCERSGW